MAEQSSLASENIPFNYSAQIAPFGQLSENMLNLELLGELCKD